MKPDPAGLVGKTFNEMYRIVRPVGSGGMGAVFEATHTRLANRRFALKVLHASIAGDEEVFARFKREAEIATALGHPHIVDVIDFNVLPDGSPYMVMEFLDGEDLASRIQKRGPMDLQAMLRIILEVCSALDAAHGAGVVHRDLKPQNIFLCRRLGRDDFVKLVDFGVSKVRDSASVHTRDNTLMGTPFYMSPEQAEGLVQQIDNRTDIFALGAIMWEMLVGRMAFEAPTVPGAMYKVVHVDPPEAHTQRDGIPPAVSAVLRRAMAKDKQARYGSVSELSADFANAIHGVMPAVAPPPLQVMVPRTMVPQGSGPVAVPRTNTPVNTPVPSHDDVAMAGTLATPMASPAVPIGTTPPQLGSQPGRPVAVPPAMSSVQPDAAVARPRSRKGVWLIASAAVLIAGGAIAAVAFKGGGKQPEQQAVTPGPEQKQPPPQPPEKQPAEIARERHAEGKKHYDLGEFEASVESFKKAYEASPEPQYLLDIAQAYQHSGDREKAVFFYQRYLSNSPDAADKASIAARIVELEHEIAEAKKPAAPNEVTLTIKIENRAPRASVTVDGIPVGPDGTIKVRRGQAALKVVVRAPAYRTWEGTIVPDADKDVPIKLIRKRDDSTNPNVFVP
jgi:serine/threonine-protein kinase